MENESSNQETQKIGIISQITSPVQSTGVGAIKGAALTAGGLALFGLTPLGPIGGGLFAIAQSLGLVTGGGFLASIQAASMTGTAVAIGAACGGALALRNKYRNDDQMQTLSLHSKL